MNHRNESPRGGLDELLGSLPKDVPPARDLWPTIEATITDARPARSRPRWPLALAAGLALAMIGGYVGSRLASPPAVASRGEPAASVGEPDMLAIRTVEARDAEFNATRAELVRTYEERLNMLSPATRARIAADLDTIHRAQEDLREALGKDPSSRVLLRLYESTTRQEFDLYTTVGRNTEPAVERTRT